MIDQPEDQGPETADSQGNALPAEPQPIAVTYHPAESVVNAAPESRAADEDACGQPPTSWGSSTLAWLTGIGFTGVLMFSEGVALIKNNDGHQAAFAWTLELAGLAIAVAVVVVTTRLRRKRKGAPKADVGGVTALLGLFFAANPALAVFLDGVFPTAGTLGVGVVGVVLTAVGLKAGVDSARRASRLEQRVAELEGQLTCPRQQAREAFGVRPR